MYGTIPKVGITEKRRNLSQGVSFSIFMASSVLKFGLLFELIVMESGAFPSVHFSVVACDRS